MKGKTVIGVVIVISLVLILFLSVRVEESNYQSLETFLDSEENLKFKNHNVGDNVTIEDKVKTAEYLPQRNITKVFFESYSNKPIYFKGDLTRNYVILPGDIIQFEITIIEHKGIHHIKEFYEPSFNKDVIS